MSIDSMDDLDDQDDLDDVSGSYHGEGVDFFGMCAHATGDDVDVDVMSMEAIFDKYTYSGMRGYAIIPPELWYRINKKHRQFEVKRAIAKHVMKHKTAFPLRPPSVAKSAKQFHELSAKPWRDLIAKSVNDGRPYQSRVPYPQWTINNTLAVIPGVSLYNSVSNHFQWENRMRCGGWKDPSPMDAWATEEGVNGLRLTFWSMDRDGPRSLYKWRHAFVLSSTGVYFASQFRPTAAKTIYGWTEAKRVLDPSCGWGDRLAGFFATNTVTVYAGCDPNPATYKDYIRQCVAYETWATATAPTIDFIEISGYPAFLSRGARDVLIVNGPFEDIEWERVKSIVAPDGFDLVFTSPPYFGVERYAVGTDMVANQSWARYNKISGWLDSFFLPMLRTSANLLADGGIIAMNVVDPVINKLANSVCGPMIDELTNRGMNFIGVVPLVLVRRPSSSSIGLATIPTDRFAEPIWIFRKGSVDIPKLADVNNFDY